MEIVGWLSEDDYRCLTCDNIVLIEEINENFSKGDQVFIRYYLSTEKRTLDEVNELQIKQIIGNIDALEFDLQAYSEYTILSLEEVLDVEGHDLFKELSDNLGKYLILQIDKK